MQAKSCVSLPSINPAARGVSQTQFPAEFVEFRRQDFIKKIYRRVIDADECDSRIKPEPETFVIRISHGSDSISVTVPDGRSVREKSVSVTLG